MSKDVTREVYDSAVKTLHVQRLGPEGQAVLAICDYQIEDAKERLVTCGAELVPTLQAQAKRFRELRNAILSGPRARGGSPSTEA